MRRTLYPPILTCSMIVILSIGHATGSPGGKKAKTKTAGGIEFVYITGGEFVMGQPESSLVYEGSSKDEQPAHRVKVSGFWMGRFEVTRKQYRALTKKNPEDLEGDNLPVIDITWGEAKKFCRDFSKKYHVKARLPYEAEWEYACRAGTGTKYFWGDAVDGNYCWYAANSGNTLHPAGQKLPNAWGLHDMAGSVFEWCEDWYGETSYSSSPYENPKGPASGTVHVMRGGWGDGLENGLRSAVRSWGDTAAGFDGFIGFRLVLEQ